MKVNLEEKLDQFDEFWSPRVVADYNDNEVMVAKLQGEYHWHVHEDSDDFFYVLDGKLDIEMPNETVTLGAGDLYVVPKGVEHKPVAHGEVHIVLIEPKGLPNTGDPKSAAPKPRI